MLPSVGAGGGGAAFTVNALESVALCPSGLVTLTLRVPVTALAAIVRPAVICVAEFTVHEFTVIPVPKLQVAPVKKFVPVSVSVRLWPCCPETGEMLPSVGAGGGG